MAGEKIVPRSESGAAAMKTHSSKFAKQDLDSGKNATPSILTSSVSSSGDATASIKGGSGQQSVAEPSASNPPTSYYDYSYPGYNGNFAKMEEYNYSDAGVGSYTGFPSDNSSLLYYMPGYDPYASGSFVGMDGQQPYYSSPGYSQHPMQGYPWNSAYYGDATNGTNGYAGKSKSSFSSNGSVKSNSYRSVKPSASVTARSSMLPFDPKMGKSVASSNISKAAVDSQAFKSWGKVGSGYQTANTAKGLFPFGKYPSFINHSQGLLMHNNNPNNYRSNNRVWNGNNKTMLRDSNGDLDASAELTCGPRVHSGANPSNPPVQEEQTGPVIQKDQYNIEEFQTEYESAKFFIIKSYSEDDVHKCVKYDVWSSTPNGNKKLNAAFNDAEAKTIETGKRSPIFLFFSVNGSGQFVGVAEMVGPVDFNKDMDFWQLDKWNGFFPLKWHIVKDLPNSQLRHIILEHNDNRPVTYSRDTQEIGLKQGIEMLNIFKSFSGKSSILDDFNFYDIREKSLKAKRSSKQASSQIESLNLGERVSDAAMGSIGSSDTTSSLINLTRNLSLNSHPLKNGAAVVNSSESSISVPSA